MWVYCFSPPPGGVLLVLHQGRFAAACAMNLARKTCYDDDGFLVVFSRVILVQFQTGCAVLRQSAPELVSVVGAEVYGVLLRFFTGTPGVVPAACCGCDVCAGLPALAAGSSHQVTCGAAAAAVRLVEGAWGSQCPSARGALVAADGCSRGSARRERQQQQRR